MANYIRVFEESHSYFITVVTHKRRAILIENIDLLRKSFQLSMKSYSYIIGAIVILPDHFHMIITPQKSNEYPKIISHIKINNCEKIIQNLVEEGEIFEISPGRVKLLE